MAVDPAGAVPEVRAGLLRDWLAFVAREPAPYAGRFVERLPREMVTRIEEAPARLWLPAGYHVAMAEALRDAFGRAREHDYYRRAFVESVRRPVLRPLFDVGARLFGLTPAAFVRWASKGYAASFRNCGTLTGEVLGEGRARGVYCGLPPVCTLSDAWIDSAQSTIYGILDLTRTEGVVRLDTSGRARGEMIVELEWATSRIP
jgi:hypothetical protein